MKTTTRYLAVFFLFVSLATSVEATTSPASTVLTETMSSPAPVITKSAPAVPPRPPDTQPDTPQEKDDGTAGPVQSSFWRPSALPADGPLIVYLFALDVSGTMDDGYRSVGGRSAFKVLAYDVPTGAYGVVIVFGTFGRVIEARLVEGDTDRQLLAGAPDGLNLNGIGAKTDIGRLEEQIAGVRDTLASHSDSLVLHVNVITDGKPDPVDPSDTRTFDRLLDHATTKTRLDGDIYRYRTTLRITGGKPPEPPGPSWWSAIYKGAPAWVWATGGGLLLLLLGGVIWVKVRPGSRQNHPGGRNGEMGRLTLEEYEVDKSGQRTRVQGPRAFPYRPGLQVKVGTNRDAALRLHTQGAPDRFVSLHFETDAVRIAPLGDLDAQVNGEPLDEPKTVSTASRLTLTGNGFEIVLTPQRRRHNPDAFFERLDREARPQNNEVTTLQP